MAYSSQGERISIGVKAHVLYSRLLSSDDYWMLLGSDTVGEVAQKLKSTSYASALDTLPPDPHRHDVEGAVKNSLMVQVESFLIHLSNPRDRFFRTWIAWYEAENLKSVFRYIAAGRMERDELRQRLYSLKSSKISYENLLMARDFAEAGDAMRGTPFQRVLDEPIKRLVSGEEHSLFPFEMAIDSYVELSLYKAMKGLEPEERRMLEPIFGTRIDLYNLYILYRALEFYDMTPEETLNRLLPVRYKIQLPFFREAVRVESFDDMSGMLQARYPAYAGIFAGALTGDEPQLTLERNLKRALYIEAQKVFGSGSPDFHTAISYFVIREFEINDIIRIIEDVRYGYDRRKAAEYLIRPILSGGEA